ncbi:MAG: protoglobin domain-containing protein [Ardenticatenaceae bacterium]|nr:protoglobin domain-containing protein [Ardenticatenaceae bacterium]
MSNIHGYTYETNATISPISLDDLDLLKQATLFSAEDEAMLRLAGDVLGDQVKEIVEVWYGFVGSHDHLLYYFSDGKGNVDADYLAKVRLRFHQWILDLCQRPYDQQWLNYQHEIGLRHTRLAKNRTDDAHAVDHIGLRYMIAFIVPITVTIRPFLAAKGHDAETVEKMYQAWFKAVTLSTVLWCAPYVTIDDF